MEIKPYLRRPQFYETDGMSIIWHGNYVRWMEESRTDFMDQLGFPYARAVEAGIDFALTDISCKYRAMTRFGEELAITVFIRRLSLKLEQGVQLDEFRGDFDLPLFHSSFLSQSGVVRASSRR